MTHSRRAIRPLIIALSAIMSISVVSIATAQSAQAGGAAAGKFFPTQGRVLDTRPSSTVGPYSTPMTPGSWRSVTVAGLAGVPTSNVTAVQLTITAYPNGTTGNASVSQDLASPSPQLAVDYGAADSAISNTTIVPMTESANILAEASSAANIVIDVQGYFQTVADQASGGYVAVNPERIASTISGIGITKGQIAGGSTVNLQVGGLNGVPSDATAAFLSIAVGNSSGTASGYLSPYAADQSRPASTLRFAAGTITEIGSTVGLSATGAISIYVGGAQSVDLWVDLEGYYEGQSDQVFLPAQTRVADGVTLSPRVTTTIQVTGVEDIPATSYDLSAAVLELEGTPSGSDAGHVTVWPTNSVMPNTAELNLQESPDPVSNLDTAKLGPDGAIQVYNGSPDTLTMNVDVQGYYLPLSSTVVAPATISDDGTVTSTERVVSEVAPTTGSAGVAASGASALSSTCSTCLPVSGVLSYWGTTAKFPTPFVMNKDPKHVCLNTGWGGYFVAGNQLGQFSNKVIVHYNLFKKIIGGWSTQSRLMWYFPLNGDEYTNCWYNNLNPGSTYAVGWEEVTNVPENYDGAYVYYRYTYAKP